MEFGGKYWIRWPIGLVALAFAFKSAFRVAQSGGMFSIGPLLFSVALLIFAAICICPEFVRAVSAPMTRWIDSIYLPGGRPDRAPLSFRLADYYVQTWQYELAAAEYERMLYDYPEEVEVYRGLVKTLDDGLGDKRTARRWLKRGLRRVQDEGERTQLRDEFARLLEPVDHRLSA